MASSNKNRGDSPKKQGDKMNQGLRDQTMGGAAGRADAEDLDTEAFARRQDEGLRPGGEMRDAGERGAASESGEANVDQRRQELEGENFLETAEEEGIGPEGTRTQRDMHGLRGGDVEERDQDIARGRSSGMTGSDSQRAQHRGGNRGSGTTGGQRSHGGRKSTKR